MVGRLQLQLTTEKETRNSSWPGSRRVANGVPAHAWRGSSTADDASWRVWSAIRGRVQSRLRSVRRANEETQDFARPYATLLVGTRTKLRTATISAFRILSALWAAKHGLPPPIHDGRLATIRHSGLPPILDGCLTATGDGGLPSIYDRCLTTIGDGRPF